jgi:hypothetical protein
MEREEMESEEIIYLWGEGGEKLKLVTRVD